MASSRYLSKIFKPVSEDCQTVVPVSTCYICYLAGKYSNVLRAVEVKVLPNGVCNYYYGLMTLTMMCVQQLFLLGNQNYQMFNKKVIARVA